MPVKSNPLPHVGTLLRIQRTPQPNVAYASGALVQQKLTLAGFVKYIGIRLSGNLTIGVAAATIFSEAPAGLIKRLELVTSDNTVLMSFTGALLYRLNHFMRSKAQELVAPGSAVGTRPFSATFFLDQEALRMADPSESLFDPGRWKDVYVNVTWGAATDIATAGGGGTIAIDAATTKLTLVVHQVPEGFDQIEFDHVHSYVEQPITASNPSLEIDIPGIGSLAGLLLQTTRDAGAGAGPVPVDNLINSVTFQSGGTQFHVNKYSWAELQRDNVSDFRLDGAAVLGDQIPGYAYLRMDDNGMFTSLFAIAAMNKPKIVLDVTRTSGTEMVRLLWDFYRVHPVARARMLAEQGAA